MLRGLALGLEASPGQPTPGPALGRQPRSGRHVRSGEIDRRWEQHIEDDFTGWLRAHMDELPVPKGTIEGFLTEPSQ